MASSQQQQQKPEYQAWQNFDTSLVPSTSSAHTTSAIINSMFSMPPSLPLTPPTPPIVSIHLPNDAFDYPGYSVS